MIAAVFLILLGIYGACGLVFAVVFAFVGVSRVDSQAAPGTVGFRLLIIPGAMALWPLLVRRWAKGMPAPVPCDAHRRAARPGTTP